MDRYKIDKEILDIYNLEIYQNGGLYYNFNLENMFNI
jgi:hypothetical protein